MITAGIYTDIPIDEYLADPCEKPSLTSELVKALTTHPPCRAWAMHPRLGNKTRPRKKEEYQDRGTAVHAISLGYGDQVVSVDCRDWRSKEAQQMRKSAYMRGQTPMLAADYDDAAGAAANVAKFLPQHFEAENVVVWNDPAGPLCRCRPDAYVLPPGGGVNVWDIKTSSDVSDEACLNAIIRYRYDIQASWHIRGLITALRLSEIPSYRWIFVQSEPPFEARTIDATPEFLSIADRDCSIAVQVWANALERDSWHGYPKSKVLEYPPWASAKAMNKHTSSAYSDNWTLMTDLLTPEELKNVSA